MKTFSTIAILLLLALPALNFSLPAIVSVNAQAPEMPLKTLIFKEQAASDAKTYFSTATNFRFWVYKAGSTVDVEKLMKTVQADKAVQSFMEGKVTGDHKEFTLVVKQPQSKKWFSDLMKKAGITHIKINNEHPVPIGNF
jgi:hypothetical protein